MIHAIERRLWWRGCKVDAVTLGPGTKQHTECRGKQTHQWEAPGGVCALHSWNAKTNWKLKDILSQFNFGPGGLVSCRVRSNFIQQDRSLMILKCKDEESEMCQLFSHVWHGTGSLVYLCLTAWNVCLLLQVVGLLLMCCDILTPTDIRV